MIDKIQIKWGSYKNYEGPYFIGSIPFSLSPNPSDDEKILAVITATEGGCYDSINMYDSCILSSGLIQWCEAHYSVSNLIGYVADSDISLLGPLEPALRQSGAYFKKKSDGKWRFFFKDARGEVNSPAKQQALFLKCDGQKGSWTKEAKDHASLWAFCVANMWLNKQAQALQVKYTADKLSVFLTKDAKSILFGPSAPIENISFVGALRAAYYSFAANLPAVASESLRSAVSQSEYKPWSEAWVIDLLKKLTFGPKIQIYPGRYNKIRPVLESIYGVNLPDFHKDLLTWSDNFSPIPGMAPDFFDIKEIQEELINQGYDLGPKGADGVFGLKTKNAIRDFQSKNKLGVDGVVGPNTRKAFVESYFRRVSK